MIPPLPPLLPQPLTLGKPKMSHRTSPLETGDSDFLLPKEAERDFLACHMVPGVGWVAVVLARVNSVPPTL